ncbi:helix-turn-helix transcriptional regulator [Streptococcus infantarius]|uniref:helix-turn-helix transcriptional regulator n=1 Tax=Streptococcus infantarius TaxID=102684 RepID=UPI00208FF7F2|nr:helix-turn-helix domain-containing protein [Streptococcus infantarius]MCO4472264.1 putative transcriptional regulator [Streptococcus infantarius subsp. infantarius]
MNVKDKIRGYRTMLGLNQSEMGKALGISKQSYYNKENGRVPFSDSEKIAFKKMLEPYFSDITLEDIFFK